MRSALVAHRGRPTPRLNETKQEERYEADRERDRYKPNACDPWGERMSSRRDGEAWNEREGEHEQLVPNSAVLLRLLSPAREPSRFPVCHAGSVPGRALGITPV